MTPGDQRLQRGWPRRMLNRLEIDRAVFFGILLRAWQFIAGPITIVLVVKYFSTEVQGLYYTFWSIIGLQTFFELAFPQMIITTASHQWNGLSLDGDGRIVGDPDAKSRLIHLMRWSMAGFVVLSLSFTVIVGSVGYWLFASDPASAAVSWRTPWVGLAILWSATFALTPCLAVLEGCNQVRSVYQFQIVRAVVGNVIVWIAIPLGAGLFVPLLATLGRLVCELVFLLGYHGRFFATFLQPCGGDRLNWRRDLWPFQSRLIIKGMFAYLNADVMLPVLFRFHGSVVAGQFGMTWNILSALRLACSSWVRVRQPLMGTLVVARDFGELDRIYFRVGTIALVVMAILTAVWVTGIATLDAIGFRYVDRVLGPLPTALLSIGLWAALVIEFQWVYIHAHGRSPYLLWSLAGNVISGLLIVALGYYGAAAGVCAAFMITHLLIFLPMSTWGWVRLRGRWQTEPVHPSPS